jgi:hypothetical protein
LSNKARRNGSESEIESESESELYDSKPESEDESGSEDEDESEEEDEAEADDDEGVETAGANSEDESEYEYESESEDDAAPAAAASVAAAASCSSTPSSTRTPGGRHATKRARIVPGGRPATKRARIVPSPAQKRSIDRSIINRGLEVCIDEARDALYQIGVSRWNIEVEFPFPRYIAYRDNHAEKFMAFFGTVPSEQASALESLFNSYMAAEYYWGKYKETRRRASDKLEVTGDSALFLGRLSAERDDIDCPTIPDLMAFLSSVRREGLNLSDLGRRYPSTVHCYNALSPEKQTELMNDFASYIKAENDYDTYKEKKQRALRLLQDQVAHSIRFLRQTSFASTGPKSKPTRVTRENETTF